MSPGSRLEIGLNVDENAPAIDRARLAGLLDFVAGAEDREGEVGVWICSDDAIADLHQRFMNIPSATDVLSFPGDSPYFGDIAVSFETAEAQAREAGHSVQREIAYLTLHGLLHLFGYDDLTALERDLMFARQDELIGAYERGFGDGWE